MIPHRTTARVLPVNAHGEVLMLLGRDEVRPDGRWFTIGGGVESGESLTDAAVREVCEEIGLRVDPSQLIGPVHVGEVLFSVDGVPVPRDDPAGAAWVAHSHFFAMALDEVDIDFAGHGADEIGFITEARWWRPDDLEADGRAAVPTLPEILRTAITTICGGDA